MSTRRMSAQQRESVCRVSGLVILNAMVFQEVLAGLEPKVLTLRRVLDAQNAASAFSDHWLYIVDNVNYVPIFKVARELLISLSANADVDATLRRLAQTASRIVSRRAALRHDLMGRVYHKLLADRKYLATYYTGIPAAALLLTLALRARPWQTRWADQEAISCFRVADLACGTGTLLAAAADAITDNFIAAQSGSAHSIDIASLQHRLARDVLRGYDVLPSAVHLTASTLALRAPQLAFEGYLWSLPLGDRTDRLGSIEFAEGDAIHTNRDLFTSVQETTQTDGHGTKESAARLEKLDLCVMNPPFARSAGGNLLFGSSAKTERMRMQRRLKALVARGTIRANITAGLGSVFVAVANEYVKPGGRIALVLPKGMLSGVSWRKTRELLSANYTLEFVVASHDPLKWNFSDSTQLGEKRDTSHILMNPKPVNAGGTVDSIQ